MRKQAKVTLIGAGPGDPDLLSLAGLAVLQVADVVLYDALVNPELLDYVPACCRRIFVGKRLGKHTCKQEEINALLVEEARQYGHVVRLKGGDPYIFGRGNEELRYVQAAGITVEVVPGMSSALALTDLVGIPLTYEGVSDNFWVMTASTQGGQLAGDISEAASMDSTAVILMGMHHLPEIVSIYDKLNKGTLPAAIIQNGSLPNQKMVVGIVSDIESRAKALQLSNPAVIIIGRVAGLVNTVPIANKSGLSS